GPRDWSSDVCSSDLEHRHALRRAPRGLRRAVAERGDREQELVEAEAREDAADDRSDDTHRYLLTARSSRRAGPRRTRRVRSSPRIVVPGRPPVKRRAETRIAAGRNRPARRASYTAAVVTPPSSSSSIA